MDPHVTEDKLSNYETLKNEALELYNTFHYVKCPAFNGKEVFFTAEGFNHILYRRPKQERDKRAQIMRFELLSKAKELLEKTNTCQEYEEYIESIQIKKQKRKVWEQLKIRDWGFIAVIKNFRIKVVVRQIGNGEKKFHSVIPAWETKYYSEIKVIRNSKGNVADD